MNHIQPVAVQGTAQMWNTWHSALQNVLWTTIAAAWKKEEMGGWIDGRGHKVIAVN